MKDVQYMVLLLGLAGGFGGEANLQGLVVMVFSGWISFAFCEHPVSHIDSKRCSGWRKYRVLPPQQRFIWQQKICAS